MEIRHLRYFLAVADEKHFGRAAKRLHMAQPPLSQQIRQLEAELGTRLFERTTRRVDLTPAGDLLVVRAQQILRALDSAKADVGDIGRGAAGILRVAFAGSATYRLMPDIVRQARNELPGVRLHVTGERLSPVMEEALLSQRIDVAIIRPPVTSSEIHLDEFETTPLVVAVPRDHPLALAETPITAAELAGHDMVSYPLNSAVASASAEIIRKAGFRPHIVQEAAETATITALVAAGMGICIMPESAAIPLHSSIVFRRLEPTVNMSLATAWLKNSASPLVIAFAELVRLSARGLANGEATVTKPVAGVGEVSVAGGSGEGAGSAELGGPGGAGAGAGSGGAGSGAGSGAADGVGSVRGAGAEPGEPVPAQAPGASTEGADTANASTVMRPMEGPVPGQTPVA